MSGLTPGVQRVGWMRGRRWPFHIGLTVTAFIIAFPLLYAALIATQNNPEIFSFKFTPGSALQSNFDAVWVKRDFAGAMLNSLQMSIWVTIGKTVLSLLAGLAFVYFKFRYKWVVFFFVLVTLMMPTEVMILAMFRTQQSRAAQTERTSDAAGDTHRPVHGVPEEREWRSDGVRLRELRL